MSNASAHTNNLINESSPYLLQHAHNPVNWVAWSDEAFQTAANEKKLVLISIGYSSCHWCHVMEKESFEDDQTASIMNANYICIKVDREERPDVDAFYMDAVQLLTGRGGWPLNCIALPDRRPLYGGTYYPRNQWQQVLLKIATLYKEHPSQCLSYADELTSGIKQIEQRLQMQTEAKKGTFNWQHIYSSFANHFDIAEGGMNRAPKFPMPANWEFLLHYHYHFKNEDLLKQIKLTLDKIAYGGIYDQAGGGFSRYSTDAQWKVPHFEKMLYDNAQLVSLYCRAYMLTRSELYKSIVYETFEFIEREMQSDGGYYSALDADSEGVEGKYYIWTKNETQEIFGKYNELASDYFNVNEKGYWEDEQYILLRDKGDDEIAKKHNVSIHELKEIVAEIKKQLLAEREKRIKPGTDDKQICSWNALMLKAWCDASVAFNDKVLLGKAITASQHFLRHFAKDDQLLRIYKAGRQKIGAFLDDYAFAIESFLLLYSLTGTDAYVVRADSWIKFALNDFFNEATGFFYYSGNTSETVVTRKTELQDNVIPSSNAVMAKNLLIAGHLFSDQRYFEIAEKMINSMHDEISDHSPWYSRWAETALFAEKDIFEIVICGKEARLYHEMLNTEYRPDALFAFSETNSALPVFEGRFNANETLIYICKNKSCFAPVKSVEDARKLLSR